MSGIHHTIGRVGSLAAALVVVSMVSPAAAQDVPAEPATVQRVEVIVSTPVSAGERPQFEVVETDLAGVIQMLGTAGESRIEWNGDANLAVAPSDPGLPGTPGSQRESLEAAWVTTLGSADVVIAVLDSGVAPSSEFGGRLLDGVSFVDADPHVDTLGHGTGVALVAAAAHDGAGVAGVCPLCSVLPVQVANDDGTVPWSAAADGIVWAVDNGADVINLSFGAHSVPSVVREAIDYAVAHDVGIVAAAGNSGSDNIFYPAGLDGVISVGGHDEGFDRHSWSGFGAWVDVAAPGCAQQIYGPSSVGCGTSFAAPWISGVLGLIDADDPTLSTAALGERLEAATVSLDWVATGWVAPGDIFAPTFTDVDPNAFYAEPIEWMVANEITSGMTPTTFAPEATVTRGQLATFLYRYTGEPPVAVGPTLGSTFVDVSQGAFYAAPVTWMVANEITSGMTPTTFEPDAAVTRGQLATFLYRYTGEPPVAVGPTLGSTFVDVSQAAFYAAPVTWMVANEITSGMTPTTFEPDAAVTRGQLATFLYRYAQS